MEKIRIIYLYIMHCSKSNLKVEMLTNSESVKSVENLAFCLKSPGYELPHFFIGGGFLPLECKTKQKIH